MPNTMIVRCGEPSKYDQSPYGTVCRSNNQSNDWFEIYVQTSHKESNPQWQLVGVFNYKNDRPESITDEVTKILTMKTH